MKGRRGKAVPEAGAGAGREAAAGGPPRDGIARRLARRAALGRALRGAWGLLLLLGLWELLHLGLDSAVVPDPLSTAARLAELLEREMPAHLGASLLRLGAASLVQLGLGLALGLALGLSRRAEALLGPAVYALFPVPKIAFLPIFMILLGLGEASKILFAATVLVFPTAVSIRDGVREIPAGHFLVARSLGLGRRGLLAHVVLPALGPRLFSSLRLGLGTGLAVLFFAENYATRHGVGYFIMNSYAMADYRSTFAGILALGLSAVILFALVDLAERRACPWMGSLGRGRD